MLGEGGASPPHPAVGHEPGARRGNGEKVGAQIAVQPSRRDWFRFFNVTRR